MNAVADSISTAINEAQRPAATDSSARKAAAPVDSAAMAAGAALRTARSDSLRRARAQAHPKRCGRFGQGAVATTETVHPDSTRPMSFGITADSTVVWGLAADASNRNWAETAQIDLGSERLNRAVCLRLLALGALPPDVAIRRLITETLRNLPKVMFVLLPLYAFLLKLVYIRRKRFYVEHFVFALHLHAFMFLLFTVMLLLRSVDFLPGVLFLWMCLYSWIAMKRVYGQGWFKTTVKWLSVGWAYFIVLSLAAVTVFVGAIFTV
jgi:hypothetical protein